jgi:hypothetical protein
MRFKQIFGVIQFYFRDKKYIYLSEKVVLHVYSSFKLETGNVTEFVVHLKHFLNILERTTQFGTGCIAYLRV